MSGSPKSSGTEGIAHVLAAWAAAVRFEDLPPAVVETIKTSTLDGLGCGIYGAALPWSKIVRDVLLDEAQGSGTVDVWGTEHRLPPSAAALANGAAVQAFEVDDYHKRAGLHGSSAMLPALFSLGELRQRSGQDLIVALAVGWEIGFRISRAFRDVHLIPRGWHAPTIVGTVAAAAASGRLLGLPVDQLAQCLGLGAVHAGGLRVVHFDGMAKRLYAGKAAQSGLLAALLAEGGYVVGGDIFEHPSGFFATFAQDRPYHLEELTDALELPLAAQDIGFKIYACCAPIHPAIDGLRDLKHMHPDLDASSVESITAYLSASSLSAAGHAYKPGSATTAQFSLPYTAAAWLLEGSAFVDQFRDDLLADPRVLDLAARIECVHEEAFDQLSDRRTTRLAVRMKSGEVLEISARSGEGYADRPGRERELREKFFALTRDAIPGPQARELAQAVDGLELIDDLTDVAALTMVRPTP